MPIRNPFTRRLGIVTNDENVRPQAELSAGFERVDTIGSKAPSVFSIRSSRGHDTGEYKMSVVNDSGVYLPPSPIESKSHRPRMYLSRNSTDTGSSLGDIEHFSISRESFDSYRRSFDISARSPVSPLNASSRGSLDSARFPRPPRTAIDYRMDRPAPTTEDPFEDIGLDDTNKQPQPQQPLKRSFFSKLSDSQSWDHTGQSVSRFLPGRKRGQSGQGSELGNMEHLPSPISRCESPVVT